MLHLLPIFGHFTFDNNLILRNFTDLSYHKGFKILGYNIRSLLPKFHQFKMELAEANCDVICINESWLRPEIDSQLVYLEGYTLTRLDRGSNPNCLGRSGGGVCTYIRDSLMHKYIESCSCIENDIEILTMEIQNETCRNMIVLNVYRPPSGDCDIAIDTLRNMCTKIIENNRRQDVVIIGDININLLSESAQKEYLFDLCNDMGINSVNQCPN